MLATIYALFCIVIVPDHAHRGPDGGRATGGVPLVMVIVMPLVYIVVGFIGGIIGASSTILSRDGFGGIEIDYE